MRLLPLTLLILLVAATHATPQTSTEEHARAIFTKLQDDVVQLLFQGRTDQAQDSVNAALRNPLMDDFAAELSSLQGLLTGAANIEGVILEGYKPDFGKRVRLRLLRTTIDFQPTRILGNRFVYGIHYYRENGIPREKRMRYVSAEIHHSERMMRLEMSGNPYAKHLMALLAWRWGERDDARQLLQALEDDPLATRLLTHMTGD